MSEKNNLSDSFHDLLNRHGYSFQHSIIKLLIDESKNTEFPWLFDVAEYPVNIKGQDTHIDFILKHSRLQFAIICECKRANPALANWCFAKAPFIHRHQINKYNIRFERINHPLGAKTLSEVVWIETTRDAYHIPLEVRSEQKGDSDSRGRGRINEALTQVLRGMNGLIEQYIERKILKEKEWLYFLPVIVTTAEIYVSDVKLDQANIKDGKVDFSKSNLLRKNWIWFQYHLSPTLKHSFNTKSESKQLHKILDAEYSRSVAIVNSSSIVEFLADVAFHMDSIPKPIYAQDE